MRKNKLIELLQSINGNPEIVILDGRICDYLSDYSESLKERMEARRPRWLERMRNDPNRQASRRCDSAWSRAPGGIDLLSAPVLRFGFRRVLEYQPFEVRGHAAVLLADLLSEERLEFAGYDDCYGCSVGFGFHRIPLAVY